MAIAIIKQLDPHVADMIAAGEVVERPASVVKELIENALDAGATAITLEIQGGGMTYIRVTDNGKGMGAEDASMAFLRYATSKLRTGRDLEAIGTLGFRGEALAAISAVSRIDLLTRAEGTEEGTAVTVEGGQVLDVRPAGCPVGTTMIVRDLFFNTPARLKFMKTDRAEAAAITAMLVSVALSHPAVSFRYIRDGKEEYHTPGDGSVRSAIYTLLGREFAVGLVEVDGQGDHVEVAGFVTAPAHARGSRGHQWFYVNGRLVRSKLLQAALEQAYKNVQFSGKFPGAVLYLTLGLGTVDVNVHPAKTEVKFVDEKRVFDGVYYAVLHALEQSRYMPEIALSKDTQRVLGGAVVTPIAAPSATKAEAPVSPPLFRQDMGSYPQPLRARDGGLRDSVAAIQQTHVLLPETPTGTNCVRPTLPQESSGDAQRVNTVRPCAADANHVFEKEACDDTNIVCPNMADATEFPHAPVEAGVPIGAERSDEDVAPYIVEMPHRVIGEALGTYILVEQGDELLFIDKHAAHERILFDRLKAESYMAMPQTLLAPILVDLGPELTVTLTEQGALLEHFGFELDQMGPGTVAVRQVPGEIDLDDMAGFLAELAEGLSLGRTPDPSGVWDEVLHTMACKAAIMAGRRSDLAELEELAARVLSGEAQYCPHGRPVSLSLSRSQLDKQVRRG
ncbi:MAG: DNA mismatch repair endonuclease MutL [Oscillospiraceae bacterium]|nr:DNA mismatch repair endonuclease MutL [Oscillospiraceae bacterium]